MNSKLLLGLICLACKCLLVLGTDQVGATASSEPKSHVPPLFDFSSFVDKYHKAYSPLETIHRAQLFFSRMLTIFKHNLLFTQNKRSYFLGQTEYTDITPAEASQLHLAADDELSPVKEALEHPNKAASSLLSVRCYLQEESGLSSCSLKDLEKNHDELDKQAKNEQTREPVLSFMEEQKVPDVEMMLQELEMKPELREKLKKLVEPGAEPRGAGEVLNKKTKLYKSVVPSNNKNYEPQMVSSRADNKGTGEVENYAKYLMQDQSFDGYRLSLYPEQQLQEEPEEEQESRSSLSSFMGSIRAIGDYFFEYEGTGVISKAHSKEEPTPSSPAMMDEKVSPPPETEGKILYKVDWRKTGCIPEPSHQDKCNACYAFATLSLLEYFYCKSTKQVTKFSAQYIVDCGTHTDLNGCQGGKISNVGRFIRRFGLELDSMYPYSGLQNQCPFQDQEEGHQKAGYLKPRITAWQTNQDMVAWYKWIRKSPIVVGINMPGDFLAYKGGIHDGQDCVADMTHAMLLVGAGSQDGHEFWLLKNSFSSSWGESGYFRLSMDAPLRCFNSAIVARATFDV